MSPTPTPPESRDCQSIAEMLGWYANGTLGTVERAAVDSHVEKCPACRATLGLECRIVETMRAPRDNVEQSPHAGWQKLVARLDSQEGVESFDESAARDARTGSGSTRNNGAATADNAAERSARRRVNWPAALGAAVAVQAAAIAVLTVALVRHRQIEEAPRYRTVLEADPTLEAHGPLVRIAFDSSVDEAMARSVAAQVDGKILAGPSPENVYTFVFPGGTDAGRILDEKVSDLRRRAHVLLVEPVVLGEPSHTE
jgi:Putative zinc-finger